MKHNYIKFALIGCGRISLNHIKAITKNRLNATLVAVCDTVNARAIEKRKFYYELMNKSSNIKVYEDYKKLLNYEDVDVVSICTESGYHAEIAIECMKAGKHVIVEKPMALSVEGANRMIETAEKYNVKLCVCHQNRFNLPIQKLRQAIRDGRFGKIIAGNARILWCRDIDYYKQARWRGTYAQDGGCLMNQCIHNIDLLQWMLGGDIEWVNGCVENFLHPYIEAEDYGSIQIKFKDGSIGNVEGTVCIYPKNFEETLTIIGEKGTVSIGGLAVNKVDYWEFEDAKDDLEQVKHECNSEVDNVYGKGHTSLYADMIDAIYENHSPYIDGIQGRIAMQIVLAAYKSSVLGHRIEFPTNNISTLDFIKK